MSQPLRSTPITGASSLLRAGPPARPHRYSTPRSFRCLAHSLSHPPPRGERAQYRHTLSHVSCSSRRSDSRRLHAGHRLASKRAPARLFPGLSTHPGFDVISCFSTLPQRFALARLSDPCLTALTPPFPRSLPTTVFSQCGIEVAWRLPPQSGAEGPQNLHLLHNIASRRSTHSTPLRIRGTREGTD